MSLGLCPEQFWRVPRRQLPAIIEGANDRLLREHNELAWLAWHTAALVRSTKKMPNIDKLMAKKSGRRKQTWQEQMAIMDQWAAHMDRIKRQRKKKR